DVVGRRRVVAVGAPLLLLFAGAESQCGRSDIATHRVEPVPRADRLDVRLEPLVGGRPHEDVGGTLATRQLAKEMTAYESCSARDQPDHRIRTLSAADRFGEPALSICAHVRSTLGSESPTS